MRYVVTAAVLLIMVLTARRAVLDVHAAVVDDDVPEYGSAPPSRFHAVQAATDAGCGNRD